MNDIKGVLDAWQYYRKIRPNFIMVNKYYSKAKHDGPEGITHIISRSLDFKEIEYLTRKSYWYDNCQKFLNDDALIPRRDKYPALADTIKTDMLRRMQNDINNGKIVKHVAVMPDSKVYVFNAELISKYVEGYNAYLDHFATGERGAVFYPQRLAEEFSTIETLEEFL